MVRFSFAGGEPIKAIVAEQGWLPGDQGDLALLELEGAPTSAARTAPLLPARAVTGHACAAYGYPSGHDGGVWSKPEITGQTVDRLQLTAQAVHGHQIEKGFSGTGLFDTEIGAVVGLVVTRDKGKDVLGGFAIPMQAVTAAFPQLRPWVGWRLTTDRFVRPHWRPRARGVYEDTTPGWYFTGRTVLLRELTSWLEHGLPGRAVRIVTGPAGAGKSALLAWLCAVSDPQLRAEITSASPQALADTAVVPAEGRVTAAIWARGLDTNGAAESLAVALALPVPPGATVDDVLAAVADLDPAERDELVVVVDALDEAKTPRQIARRLLLPLVRDLEIKLLTGTRPGRDDGLLAAFGDRAIIYRLDAPEWFDRHDLADYAAACLRADFDLALSSGYRTNLRACGQVAGAIADVAGSNFLIAGLAARARAEEPVIDVNVSGWQQRQRFPAEVGEAFGDYLSRFGDDEPRARDLLRALAYAEGAGLAADKLWARMASALAPPRRYGNNDLAWLLDSAAGYLIESSDELGQPVYRLFHQALTDYLRPEERETQRQRTLIEVLRREVPLGPAGLDWAHASVYIREHLATHAAAAGQLDDFLRDPDFLIAVDPAGLLPVLDSVSSPESHQVAWFYRIATDGLRSTELAERAAYLQLAAGKAGHQQMANAFETMASSWRWSTRVLSWRRPGRYTALGCTDYAKASALVLTAQGEVSILTNGDDGKVALWRASDEGLALAGEPQRSHGDSASALQVAVGHVGGRGFAVTGGSDGTVALWRVSDEGLVPVDDPQNGHDSEVRAVAVGQVGARGFAGTDESHDMGALWRLTDEGLVSAVDPPDGDDVSAFAVGPVGMAVTGDAEGMVALWRVSDKGLIPLGDPQPDFDFDSWISSVAVGDIGGRIFVVTAGGYGWVGLWRASKEGLIPVGYQRSDHAGLLGVRVAVGQVGGQGFAVTGGSDGTVALWRITDGGLIRVGDTQAGHGGLRGMEAEAAGPRGVQAVAVGQVGGQGVAVTGASDGTVALWRITDEGLIQLSAPQFGHGRPVLAVVLREVAGQVFVVTSAEDGTVALWRVSGNWSTSASSLSGRPRAGAKVLGVAIGEVDGRAIAVASAGDGTSAMWWISDAGMVQIGDTQPGTGMPFGRGAVAVGQVGGQGVAVTGANHTLALWRITDEGLVQVGDWHQFRHDSPFGIVAVAVGEIGGQDIAVTGTYDTLKLWRVSHEGLLPAGDPYDIRGEPFSVDAVALGEVAGQGVVVTGSHEGTVALWHLHDKQLALAGDPRHGHGGTDGVQAVAVGQVDGQTVAVTGGNDGTVALWRLSADGPVLAGTPQYGHGGGVPAVAVGQVDGQAVAVTGGSDGAIQLWRLYGERLVRIPTVRITVGSPPINATFLSEGRLLAWCEAGVLTISLRKT